LASMPTTRAFPSVAALDSRIYVIGGSPASNLFQLDVSTVEVLDTTTGTWSSAPAVPNAREGAAAAVVGGRIYVIGGFSRATNSYVSAVDVFDPLTNAWSSAAGIPTPRSYAGVAIVNGQIHVLGGNAAAGVTTAHEVYDPPSDGWVSSDSL